LENGGKRQILQCIEFNGTRYMQSKKSLETSDTVRINAENIDEKLIDPKAIEMVKKVARKMIRYRAKRITYDGKIDMKKMTIEEENKMPRNATLSYELTNRPCIWADGVLSCPSQKFPSSFDSIIEANYGGKTAL
jgi:hypothetical protein